MSKFITNIEVILATDEEIERYYEAAADKINHLLSQYAVRDVDGELAVITVDRLKAQWSLECLFESTPIASIFFNQKQQFVPQDIIQSFRSIVSDAPDNIKAVFFHQFLLWLEQKGWDQSLSAYFERRYDFPSDGIVVLQALKDCSIGAAVYGVTFQLRSLHREKITVFLKQGTRDQFCNERLYARLQKQLLLTARFAEEPFDLVSADAQEVLMLSPEISGVASDVMLSTLQYAYQHAERHDDKNLFQQTLKIFIDAFIRHSVLGDMLGRNDRHLLNSLIAPIVDGVPVHNTRNLIHHPDSLLSFCRRLVLDEGEAFSLIDFDIAWLLGEENAQYSLDDIDCGLSELNLLSLLAEFNDYDAELNPFFDQRKETIEHCFSVYCQQLDSILGERDTVFSEIAVCFSSERVDEKSKILQERILFFEDSVDAVIQLFERYLLNFRIRRVYKDTLFSLYSMAMQVNQVDLLDALRDAELLHYLPPGSVLASYNPSVFLQLQCFRGVRGDAWDTISSSIATIAERFNGELFSTLEDKKQFIITDSAELLECLQPMESYSNTFL